MSIFIILKLVLHYLNNSSRFFISCGSTLRFYWCCGHITEQHHACNPGDCWTNDFPNICTDLLIDCGKCYNGKTKPYPPEVREQLTANFLLEKARYGQQFQDIRTQQRELCEVPAELLTLDQALWLDFLWKDLEDNLSYLISIGATRPIRKKQLEDAMIKALFRLFEGRTDPKICNHFRLIVNFFIDQIFELDMSSGKLHADQEGLKHSRCRTCSARSFSI